MQYPQLSFSKLLLPGHKTITKKINIPLYICTTVSFSSVHGLLDWPHFLSIVIRAAITVDVQCLCDVVHSKALRPVGKHKLYLKMVH